MSWRCARLHQGYEDGRSSGKAKRRLAELSMYCGSYLLEKMECVDERSDKRRRIPTV